jgi:hypothetical protein
VWFTPVVEPSQAKIVASGSEKSEVQGEAVKDESALDAKKEASDDEEEEERSWRRGYDAE